MSVTLVGTVGSPHRASVDARGRVAPASGAWSLDWRVGADDRWHVAAEEVAVRQRLLGPAPVVETAMRVPGGDAVQRVYAAGPADLVVEVENRSPVPFALALVPSGRAPHVRLSRAPSDLGEEVAPGALMVPVAHRTAVRAVVALDGATDLPDPARLPSAADVLAGWQALLRHGMTVEVPDEPLQRSVDTARALLLLFDDGDRVTPDPLGGTRHKADVAAVLAARDAWDLARHSAELRRPRRLPRPEAGELSVPGWWHGGEVARFLLAARDLFVREEADGSAALLPGHYPGPVGAPLEVHGGPVSFAVRWHGERPALLWESARPRRLTCPGLDPTWETEEAAGEALLRAVPAPAGGAATSP